jgi:hypothetical protein
LVLLLHPARRARRLVAISVAWYVVPATYIWLTLLTYSKSAGATYQEHVMRRSWQLRSLLSDLWFNVDASLRFWNWTHAGSNAPSGWIVAISCLAVVVFLGGALLLASRSAALLSAFPPSSRTWWIVLATGSALLLLSFPVYLLLDSARSLWRTQLLSSVACAVVFSAVIGLVAQSTPFAQRGRALLILMLATPIVFCGSMGALQLGAIHRANWERHRLAIARVLRAAPGLTREAVVVLTNVPKDDDPFGHDMWFDVALRLAYPGVPVAAIYFYADGTKAPGDNLRIEGNRWKWDGTGYPPLLRDASLANTIVVNDDPARGTPLESAIPGYVCSEGCQMDLYRPSAMISPDMSPRTKRRYRLDFALLNLTEQ